MLSPRRLVPRTLSATSHRCGRLLAACALFLTTLVGCDPAANVPGLPGEEVSGTWNDVDGLTLTSGGVTLFVPPGVTPSNTNITLRAISADDELPDGVAAGDGFDAGAIFGPAGTTFSGPVTVTVTLSSAAAIDTLPVLLRDEVGGTWGWAGVDASVADDGVTATFEVTHFSSYRPWNPPPPPGDLPIEDGEIIAGTGFFSGQPFSTFPNPRAATASLAYTPFGDMFGLSLIQVDVLNPTTGDFITLAAGLHASQVFELETARVGLVTPVGAPSGPSLYEDGGPPKGVSGIMYLRKSATQWMVDVYCAYEGGIIFGQASGDL